MADHSEVAIQHLGVLTVSSTPAQIAAALANAGAVEIASAPMDVDGASDNVEEGIRNRMNSFVAPQGEDPLALLSSSSNGVSTQNKVPKAVVSEDEDEEEDDEDDEEDDDDDADAESAKASMDVSRSHFSIISIDFFF